MSEPKLDNPESRLALAEFDVRQLRIELDLALRRLEEARQRNTIADMQRTEIASMCGTQEGEDLLASVDRVVRERDAYKKAKEENDERFMRERDEARAALSALVTEGEP